MKITWNCVNGGAMRCDDQRKLDNLTDKSIGTVFYVGVTGEQEDNVSNVHNNVIVDIVDGTSSPT